MAAARGASVHMSTGVNMGRQGTLAYWLLHMLSFASGNLDRRGGNILSVGFYPAAKAGRREFAAELRRHRVRPAAPRRAAGQPAGRRDPRRREPGARADRRRGQSAALDRRRGAPARGVREARAARLHRPLQERHRRVRALAPAVDRHVRARRHQHHRPRPAVAARGSSGRTPSSRPRASGARSGGSTRGSRRRSATRARSTRDRARDLWGRIDHMLRSRGHSLEELRAGGEPLVFEPLTPGRFFGEQLQTADGKVDCCPPAFADALARAEEIFAELEGEGLSRLKLVTRRDPYMHNSWYANVPVDEARRARPQLALRPPRRRARARPRGRREGARSRTRTARSSSRSATTTGLMRGVVALTHGWGNRGSTGMRVAARTPGVNANALLPIGPGQLRAALEPGVHDGSPGGAGRAVATTRLTWARSHNGRVGSAPLRAAHPLQSWRRIR